jgi:hypothetical protein
MLTYDTPALRQTGSRNLTGPKTLVTKYQISAINSYWEKCDKKYLGRTDRGKTVYPPPSSGSGGINTLLKLPVGASPLQLVNLHRNRKYFVIKLDTWFCLSYFLKSNKTFYCIYQYFMSINSFFNTVSVSRYRYIYKLLTWVTLINHAESECFKSVIQTGRSLFLSKIKIHH